MHPLLSTTKRIINRSAPQSQEHTPHTRLSLFVRRHDFVSTAARTALAQLNLLSSLQSVQADVVAEFALATYDAPEHAAGTNGSAAPQQRANGSCPAVSRARESHVPVQAQAAIHCLLTAPVPLRLIPVPFRCSNRRCHFTYVHNVDECSPRSIPPVPPPVWLTSADHEALAAPSCCCRLEKGQQDPEPLVDEEQDVL